MPFSVFKHEKVYMCVYESNHDYKTRVYKRLTCQETAVDVGSTAFNSWEFNAMSNHLGQQLQQLQLSVAIWRTSDLSQHWEHLKAYILHEPRRVNVFLQKHTLGRWKGKTFYSFPFSLQKQEQMTKRPPQALTANIHWSADLGRLDFRVPNYHYGKWSGTDGVGFRLWYSIFLEWDQPHQFLGNSIQKCAAHCFFPISSVSSIR